ncbi:hypothetical protein CH06BL_21600 [Chromobacterium haemolyticum]|nr:hypothetical protein CH06BL_21600 [Chromobacterium haemolyticum]
MWAWFCELSVGRQYSDSGPQALACMEMEAWARITQRRPRAWEYALLRRLDVEFLSIQGMDEGEFMLDVLEDDEARSRALMAMLGTR